MTKNFFRCIEAIALTLVGAMAITPLHAQGADASPSLQEQLEAQYPTAKFSSRGGCTVSNPETGMLLQKSGIGALPQTSSSTMCAAHYRNGAITRPGFKCNYYLNLTKQALVTLEKGDKVYPTKIEVAKDEVRVAFGYCSGDPGRAALYVGQVVIEFPKDTLKTTGVPQVEDKIAEVFTPDNAGQQQEQQQGEQPPQAQDNENQQNAPDNQQQADNNQAPQQEPPSIEIGQTIEQVVAAWGQPDKKVNLGAKQIYVYKDLKVTFIGGKVSDVQ